MGIGTIPTRAQPAVILADHMNAIKRALTGSLYPRGVNGKVSDLAGGLGTSAYVWDELYAQSLKLKSDSDNLIDLINSGVAYALTLPAALPAASNKRKVILDASGNVLLAVANMQESAAINYTAASALEVDVASVSHTSYGNPVEFGLYATGTNARVFTSTDVASSGGCTLRLYRGATVLQLINVTSMGDSGLNASSAPASAYRTIDFPVAGTYTYKITLQKHGGTTASITGCKFYARETTI